MVMTNMIDFESIEKEIPDVTGVMVLVIAASAFCLSFYNLQLQAIESGINPWLSWLWPVCIDATLIAGSLMILRASLRNTSPVVGWAVLLSFTSVSVGFNVIHSPPDIISQLAHAVPPIALCVSIELLMLCIKTEVTNTKKPVITKNNIKITKVTSEDVLCYFEKHQDHTNKQAAAALNVSATHIGRLKKCQ